MPRYMDAWKEAQCPNLSRDKYEATSDHDPVYNCVAHALVIADAWWWPDNARTSAWLPGIEKSETVECFVETLAALGFTRCESLEPEAGFSKVALYVGEDGIPKHMARQLPSGRWTSKLGDWEDIEHIDLASLEDEVYGKAAIAFRRAT